MLLEREDQIERLRTLLTQASAGRGSVVALVGEAGVGKTSLVESFAATIEGRARVLRSACEDLSIPEPLGPLYDLSRALGPLLPVAGVEVPRLRLFSEALQLFDKAGLATLLLIDDVHWADDATLDLIRFLGRRITGTHVLLLLTARNDATDGQRRLRRALAEIPTQSLVRMEVPLLSEGAVAGLALSAGLDPRSLFRLTAGNPFFTSELIRAGVADVPPVSVTDAVLRRVERLAPAARHFLNIAAVFPRRCETEVLLEIAGAEGVEALADSLGAGLLNATEEYVQFRHEIARRAVEAAMSERDRRVINGRVLAALRKLASVPAARLVHHARQARNVAVLRALVPQAASEASALGAHHEAADMLAAILEDQDGSDFPERDDLLVRLAIEHYLLGRTRAALDRLEEARVGFAQKGDILQEGDCLRWLSRLNYLDGNRVSAEQQATAAVDLLSLGKPGPELAMARSNQSQLAMLADRIDDTVRFGQAAIDLATALGRNDIVAHSLNNLGAVHQWLDLGSARDLLSRSLGLALEFDLQEHVARAYTNLACVLINWRAHAEAEATLNAGIAYCMERDLDTWRDYMRAWRAELLLRTGRWDEAGSNAIAVLDNPQATPLARFPAAVALARLRIRRGDDADALLRQLESYLVRGSELQRCAPYAVLRAEAAWIAGSGHVEALQLLEQSIAMLPNGKLMPELFFWHEKFGGLPSGAHAAVPFAAEDMQFERAVELWDGAEDDRVVATSLMKRLGADAVLRRLGTNLSASGRPPRGPAKTTRNNPHGMTTRELNILLLLCQGLSNKAIARELAISAKTVDHHVSAVLGKLDVSSRLEAATKARALGLA